MQESLMRKQFMYTVSTWLDITATLWEMYRPQILSIMFIKIVLKVRYLTDEINIIFFC